jgi:hypothetical protein
VPVGRREWVSHDPRRASGCGLAPARDSHKAARMTNLKILALCSLAISCKGGGDHAGAPADKTASADEAAPAAAKLVYKPLGSLGLEAQVPDDANIDDNTKSAGFPSATIWAQPTTFVMGAGADSLEPQTFDAAKQEVQKDPNPFQKFTKQEATPDGWKLEYELQSSIDKATIYGYKVRFKIDGKPFDCGSNGRTTSERDAVVKICSTIRKHG